MNIGDKFGKWTVIGESFLRPGEKRNRRVCAAQCECGTIKDIPVEHLKYGQSKQCLECAQKRARAKVNWQQVSRHYSAGKNWKQISKLVGINEETLRMRRRKHKYRKSIVTLRGKIGYFAINPNFQEMQRALIHFQDRPGAMMRAYYMECALREIEELRARLDSTSEKVKALLARGREYVDIAERLGITAEGVYLADKRLQESCVAHIDLEAITKLEAQGKTWAAINRTLKRPFESSIILKEVFYFLLAHKIEMDELAGV